MVFTPPAWVPKLPFDPPDSIPIHEFMFNERYGRHPFKDSRPPFICGLSGASRSNEEIKERFELLARGLAQELGWHPNKGTEWDKVIGVFAVNTIDTPVLMWATHRLSGISTPANAAYSASELEHQLKITGANVLFTCLPQLPIALEAAQKVGIPKNRIFLLELPKEFTGGQSAPTEFKTLSHLVQKGSQSPPLEELKWSIGQGARQCAFICASSGTSGLPKGVMISHRNVIANTMQIKAFESIMKQETEVVLGLLPQSHIYALVEICHASPYRGDSVVTLPKLQMETLLEAIQRFKINVLFLVPPLIITMANNQKLLDKYNLDSVEAIFTGAAPLGAETADQLQRQRPAWKIRQAYGLTESSTVICSSTIHDIWFGSSGSLMPAVEARLLKPEGKEVTEYGQPGELVVRAPSIVLGYLNNEAATKETFRDGWLHTGDEAIIKKSPNGYEHVFIVDRIKELIKVQGMQVAPAELEAHILTHPTVADVAVIAVPDERAGEVPKAFVVKAAGIGLEENEKLLRRKIQRHVEQHKAKHKWLKGGVEFVDAVPKSASGKILRRMLRAQERERRRKAGAKL